MFRPSLNKKETEYIDLNKINNSTVYIYILNIIIVNN